MQSVRCDACGAESILPELFVTEPGLRHMEERHCPACRDGAEGKNEPVPGWPAAILVALLLVVWFFDPTAWIVSFVLLAPALTILHEYLHAIPAWLLGGRVLELRVGSGGKPRWRWGHLLLTNWLVGGGRCVAVFPRQTMSLWHHLFFVGLPLTFHLCAALSLIWIGLPGDGDATVGQVFAVLNGFIFLENLFGAGSDGWCIARLLAGGRKAVAQSTQAYQANAASYALDERRFSQAIAQAREAEQFLPGPLLGGMIYSTYLHAGAGDDAERMVQYAGYEDDLHTDETRKQARGHGHVDEEQSRRLAMVSVRFVQDRPEEAVAEVERLLAQETDEVVRAVLYALHAWGLLELEHYDAAEQAAREAFARLPWVPVVKLVRAGVLVSRGTQAAGLGLLDGFEFPFSGTAEAWRAVVLARTGLRTRALAALEQARADPTTAPRLLRRATSMVGYGIETD